MAELHNTSSKEDVRNVEKIERETTNASGLSDEEEQFLATFPPEREAKVYQKVRCRHHLCYQQSPNSRQLDWRLVPALSVLYLLAIIDRANIGGTYPLLA